MSFQTLAFGMWGQPALYGRMKKRRIRFRR
jgi:hypothetical protein